MCPVLCTTQSVAARTKSGKCKEDEWGDEKYTMVTVTIITIIIMMALIIVEMQSEKPH